MRPHARRKTPDARPALILPVVVDRTAECLPLPAFQVLGAHAHGIGWRHVVRLWFSVPDHGSRVTRPGSRPIVVDVGGKTAEQRHAALAATFAGGGVVRVEVLAVRRLADGIEQWNDGIVE